MQSQRIEGLLSGLFGIVAVWPMMMFALNAQENVPGRWHFQEFGKSEACILVGEGFNSGLAISDVPNNIMISVTPLRFRG